MIIIHRAEEPEILRSKGKIAQQAFCTIYDWGINTFDFDSNIYAHQTVKEALKTMQHDKCCFCEAKISHISFGDVEHYRPKAGYKQDSSEPMQKPGYYWLAYNWDNLLLCCTLCNQQYKKNLFPLLEPKKRARNHHNDITAEEPLLINPTVVNPKDFIGFHAEIPYAIDGNVYGKTTIDILGLDREKLNEQRRTRLAYIARLLNVIKLADSELSTDLQRLVEETKLDLKQFVSPNAEYSAMISAYISDFVD